MWRIIAVISCLSLLGCSAQHKINRAYELLEQAKRSDPGLVESLSKDSTRREIILPPTKTGFAFSFPKDTITRYLSKDNVVLRTKRVHDTIYQQVLCPPDTLVVYDTHEREVFRARITYKAYIKDLLGWNNFEFYLAHILLGAAGLIVLYVKLIKPKFL
jgi:hypothetical protein